MGAKAHILLAHRQEALGYHGHPTPTPIPKTNMAHSRGSRVVVSMEEESMNSGRRFPSGKSITIGVPPPQVEWGAGGLAMS